MQEEPLPKSERIASVAFIRWSKAEVISALLDDWTEPDTEEILVTREIIAGLVDEYTTDRRSLRELQKTKKADLINRLEREHRLEFEEEQTHLTKKQLCQLAAENKVMVDD